MSIATLHLTNAYHESSGGIRTMYHALLAQAEIEHRSMTLVVPGDTDREEPRGRFTRIVHVRWLARERCAQSRARRGLLPRRPARTACEGGAARLFVERATSM